METKERFLFLSNEAAVGYAFCGDSPRLSQPAPITTVDPKFCLGKSKPFLCPQANTFIFIYMADRQPQVTTIAQNTRLQHSPSMASNPSTSHLDCQNECREIHEKKSQLGHLARILARRTQLERQQLCSTYTAMYGQDLVEHLQRAQAAGQRNEVCTLLSLWMLGPHERDVVLAKQSLAIGDNQYIALVEIYVGRKPRQILLMKQSYLARFKRHLDYDIASSEPKSPYQKILAALDAAHKSHDMDVSLHVAQWDAKRLYEAVEGRAEATDEAVVIEILSKRCLPQLKLMLSCYKHIYGHDLTKTLKKKTEGEFEDSFLMTVKCMYTPAKYYAKMLYKSIKGLTTDKNILPRALMNVIETDRKEVEKAFQTKYGMKIHEAIQGSMPDGEYKEFLLALATPSIR